MCISDSNYSSPPPPPLSLKKNSRLGFLSSIISLFHVSRVLNYPILTQIPYPRILTRPCTVSMDEGSSRGGGEGGGESSSSRVTPSYVKLGDRQIFTVELRPGETTFVSWKKLMKDANKVNNRSAPAAPDPPPVNAHPNLESRIAPVSPSHLHYLIA
jgi:ubinuclein